MDTSSLPDRFPTQHTITVASNLLDSRHHLIVLLSREGIIVEINATFAKVLGLPVSGLQGTNFWNYLIDANSGLWQETFHKVLSDNTEAAIDKELKEVWFRFTFTPWRNSSSDIAGVQITGIDITEPKRNEQFAYGTLDALDANICVLDITGSIIAVNRSWRTFAAENGYTPPPRDSSSNYLAVCDAVSGAELEQAIAFASGIREVIDGQRNAFSMEYPCHSPTEKRWFVGRVTRFPYGQHPRLVIAHENITRRRLAEEALQAREESLRRLGDNLPSGYIFQLVGANTGYREFSYVSAGMEKTRGIKTKDVLQNAEIFYTQIFEEDRTALKEKEAESMRTMLPFHAEFRVQMGSQIRWMYQRSAPSQLDEGQVRWDGLELDITERKRLEELLRHSQKMEVVGRLTGGMAHEFNNMLAGMMMNLSLAQMNGGKVSAEALSDLQDTCSKTAELIRQLLALSRQSVLQLEQIDLVSIVSEHIQVIKRFLGEQMEVRLTTSGEVSWVHGDKHLIEQVLLNLFLNAQDAMQNRGRIRVQVSQVHISEDQAQHHLESRAGSFARIDVQDSGSGMDADTLKRIFEPFFTTKEVGCGIGLGLATVRGIIQQHRGWIHVESSPGQGSTFSVYLPIMTQVSSIDPPPSTADDSCSDKVTILLIEDDERLRKSTRALLTQKGYSVFDASESSEAIRLWSINKDAIDLIYSDMNLPGDFTGLQLIHRFLSEKKDLRAILTSGYNTEITDIKTSDGCSILYLPKPSPPVTILAAISNSLRNLHTKDR